MMALSVLNKLIKNGLTIAFAESMTGGKASYELIKNPKASQVIKGSIIAYSNIQKVKLLHIKESIILEHGVVSKRVAENMAHAICNIMSSDIGVGITGNAGPTLQPHTAKQEAYIAITFKSQTETYHLDLSGLTRLQAMTKTTKFLYQKLDQII